MRSTTSGGDTQLCWGETVVQSWDWFVLFKCSTELSFQEDKLFITPPHGWAHLDSSKKKQQKTNKNHKKMLLLCLKRAGEVNLYTNRAPIEHLYRAFCWTSTISTSLSEEAILTWALSWELSLFDSWSSTCPEMNERKSHSHCGSRGKHSGPADTWRLQLCDKQNKKKRRKKKWSHKVNTWVISAGNDGRQSRRFKGHLAAANANC